MQKDHVIKLQRHLLDAVRSFGSSGFWVKTFIKVWLVSKYHLYEFNDPKSPHRYTVIAIHSM